MDLVQRYDDTCHVVGGAREAQQIHGLVRGQRRAGQRLVALPRRRDRGALREDIPRALGLHRGRQRRLLGPQIEELRLRALLGLAHLHLLRGDEARDLRAGIVEVARDDRLHRADDHARGLEADLDAMGAVVALGRGVRVRVDVERVVRARLHARLAADAPVAVEVDDAVRPSVERDGGADRHARGVVAVVAAHHREVTPRVRERTLLDVLHPGAVHAQRDLVLLLARHRAGVAADAFPLVDHEAVAHARAPSPPAVSTR
jgi:hypothetical protein